MLKFFGVEPVIVFDGDRLPAKASEEGTRRQRREEAKQKGRERLEQGNREVFGVYVYAELRYFAEDGVGVDCGVEERRY